MEQRVTTTFWLDFSIADAFGKNAVQDTFNRAFDNWKNNYKYLTELVMVLNHKCWAWHEKNNELCELYSDLYYYARDYAYDNLTGAELEFFYHVTD